ncbi:hypothetical protein SERLA73DRAFT_189418 [Serpula lacrymans var. lacrymans S7.3]|uniref:AB hydrolase-1 domain-containing protein n=2 Tax=Serpula lacrymans var. lacrymans TaxID=341189 RepID=F8QDM0_SERL3|nr:uncharacterized protein SERLADRAFT_480228 [Serpula lacrymans var. lacrymans S7.9]EGN93691.1 hypothetical protein SERLA73DRAFT_189418 [Serpula lacrymans var. lacrymans S7.3]EGO19061.1 hypothetical protein SERLADRAFT_480228 [Serpula lacrymans var. lacrymans S7.9]
MASIQVNLQVSCHQPKKMAIPITNIRTVSADGVDIFYREAGDPAAPTVLLLHGYPASSFSYRNLIMALAPKYHVIAPDLPGFGFTVVPTERNYVYTFANFAKTVEAFTDVLKLTRYSMYVFDYGAPTGFRLALSRPDAITAIITQNGNAFVEGLGPFWDNIRPYWKNPNPETRESTRWLTSFGAIKWQYDTGEANPASIPPETYNLDDHLLSRPGNVDIQLDLFLDYATNIELYPAFHEYLRKYQPPVLAIWGANDEVFVPAGATAFKRVLPNAQVDFVDGGHFALENHLEVIATKMLEFLERSV